MLLNIEFDYEEEISLDFNFEDKAKQVINEALTQHNMPYDCNVSISIVSEEAIQTLNKDSRGIDKITDVLSFPNLEYEKIGDFSICEDEDLYYDLFDPETERLILGDIVICYKRATEQAVEYGHSLEREMLFLVAHSILHLLGYDHMVDDEREVMEAKQREILDNLGIVR
ncbi:MAG: rRNA maturation RNase YbeY [Lachnospiraceae bacterium]|nr:rRNA maturation RNase YbeY [Lachnospiraceae bacterium]